MRNSTIARDSGRQVEPLEHLPRHPHAFHRVIVVAPFADVVKEQRQDQQLGRGEIGQQPR